MAIAILIADFFQASLDELAGSKLGSQWPGGRIPISFRGQGQRGQSVAERDRLTGVCGDYHRGCMLSSFAATAKEKKQAAALKGFLLAQGHQLN